MNQSYSVLFLLNTKSIRMADIQKVWKVEEDAKRNRTVLNLEPGAGRSVHGSAPWTISSNGLSSVTIYYQGSKLMVPENAGQRIYLAEQVVSP